MSKRTKVCSHCHKVKPITDFYNDKSNPDGRRHGCKECEKLSKSGDISLNELMALPGRKSGREWTLQEAKKILKIYIRSRRTNKSLKEALQKAKSERSEISVKYFITELKKAAKEGMTLKQYLDAGRPYSPSYRLRAVVIKGSR